MMILDPMGNAARYSWEVTTEWSREWHFTTHGRLTFRSDTLGREPLKFEGVGQGATPSKSAGAAWREALGRSPYTEAVETTQLGDSVRTFATPGTDADSTPAVVLHRDARLKPIRTHRANRQ